jgi:hypothetical protein
MYGIEESTGLGGLAAQAPGGDAYLPGALRIRSVSADLVGQANQVGVMLPNTPAAGYGNIAHISGDGSQVERPMSRIGSFSEILDFHNSPAPWILLGILVLYGWLHVQVRAGRHKIAI